MTHHLRRFAAFAALVLLVVACGGAEIDPPAPSTSTTTLPPQTVTTTSEAPTTTSSSTPADTTLAGLEPIAIPRLDNGLPATFVAVTENWEAVEIDTATGEVVRSIGQLDQSSETGEEPGFFNAIQNIWRSPDGAWYAISTCCEPAAGAIYFIPQNGTLNTDNVDEAILTSGFTSLPSPFDARFATLGFAVEVGELGAEPDVLFFPDGTGMPTGSVVWHNNGSQVSWLSSDRGRPNLATLDLDDPDSGPDVVPLEWVEEDQWLEGIGMQESGRFVAFLNTQSDDAETPELIRTEGVVFDEFGLVATFPVELGSFWGGYDPSGRVLIYTDGFNKVRWQGLGRSGVLGDGYLHASW